MPPSVEERLAYLEGKVEDHTRGFGEVRDLLVHVDGHVRALDQKVDRFREELAERIDGVSQGFGARIDGLDRKIDRFRGELSTRIDGLGQGLSARMDAMDQKIDRFREELAGRIDIMDRNASRQFRWLVGMMFGMILTLVAALFRG